MDVLSVCLLINSLLALCCFGVAFRILRTDCEKGKRPTHVHKAIKCVSYMRLFSVGESRSAALCSCVCGVAALALLHIRFIGGNASSSSTTDLIINTSTSLGLWGSLGGVEEVLLASTIIHSLAAPFYMFCIFNVCLGYTCIFAQPSGDGVGVGRIVFSILLLLGLDLSGAVFSGMLYNNVPAAKNNTTAF